MGAFAFLCTVMERRHGGRSEIVLCPGGVAVPAPGLELRFLSSPDPAMDTLEQVLASAAERARALEAPYAGALLPVEAHSVLQGLPEAVLLDVRTQAEIDWVGFVPGALHIEWQRYPGGIANPGFLAQLQALVPAERTVLFLCRSGGRSHAAAALAAQAGYARAYNVLQGFEGDRDGDGHRNVTGGWRAAHLPWKQG